MRKISDSGKLTVKMFDIYRGKKVIYPKLVKFVEDFSDLWVSWVNPDPRSQVSYSSSREKEPYISYSWVTGGVTGGSCWGGTHSPRGADPEPEFIVLDDLLEKICPSITYLQYKKIVQLMEVSEDYESEYYGNSTCYTIKKLYLIDLIEKLDEMGLLGE